MRGAVRIAHQETPGAAELGVHVAVRLYAILDQGADQRIDAVVRTLAGKRSFRKIGHEAGVINQEIHVGEAIGHDANVAALAVFVRLLAERQSLVHADHLDAERARFLDEADADVVGQEEAVAIQTPLRIGLPGADLPAVAQFLHVLDVARLVGIDAAVDQQAMVAFHAVHDLAHGVRRFDRQRRGIAPGGDEGQHHHVGIAVHEHVLDEFLRRQTSEVAARAGLVVQLAIAFGRELECRLGGGFYPGAGRVDEVALHVEDELRFFQGSLGQLRLECRLGRQVEEAASLARPGIGGVEREQGACCPGRRQEEVAPAEAEAIRIVRCGFLCELIGSAIGGGERYRLELAVGRGIQLDGQALAFGIDEMFHGSPPGWVRVSIGAPPRACMPAQLQTMGRGRESLLSPHFDRDIAHQLERRIVLRHQERGGGTDRALRFAVEAFQA